MVGGAVTKHSVKVLKEGLSVFSGDLDNFLGCVIGHRKFDLCQDMTTTITLGNALGGQGGERRRCAVRDRSHAHVRVHGEQRHWRRCYNGQSNRSIFRFECGNVHPFWLCGRSTFWEAHIFALAHTNSTHSRILRDV